MMKTDNLLGTELAKRYSIDQMRLLGEAGNMFDALKALASTARTFRDVPKDEQEWTSIDDDALNYAFSVIDKVSGQ